MIVKKRLNNNAVIAADEHNQEKILIGCGLGFQKKEGTEVDESKIEKVFILEDSRVQEQMKELLRDIPIEYVTLADDILTFARIHVNHHVSENVIVALCDHIYMAVERKRKGISVKNVLLWDIRQYYHEEYKAGLYAIQIVEERFQVQLGEDEAGFIALHIVNAQMDLSTKTIQEITTVMQEIETIVRVTFQKKLDANSVYYYRFITHLKFFAERLFSQKAYDNQDMSGLMEIIKTKYQEAYQCSLKIALFIKKKYGYCLGEEEILYLSIHIARVVQVSK